MVDTVIKVCTKHGETVHSVQKRYHRCRKCMYEAVKRRRVKVKQMAVDYKGGKCESCGYDKCHAALEFHHTDPTQKDFAIGPTTHNKAWTVVQAELDKCLMLCANCHREEHVRLRLD